MTDDDARTAVTGATTRKHWLETPRQRLDRTRREREAELRRVGRVPLADEGEGGALTEYDPIESMTGRNHE